MKIGKKWEIVSDPMNITLKQKIRVKASAKQPAHDSWRVEGYFGTVMEALRFLVNYEVSETDLKDMQTIVKKQDELYKLIEGLK